MLPQRTLRWKLIWTSVYRQNSSSFFIRRRGCVIDPDLIRLLLPHQVPGAVSPASFSNLICPPTHPNTLIFNFKRLWKTSIIVHMYKYSNYTWVEASSFSWSSVSAVVEGVCAQSLHLSKPSINCSVPGVANIKGQRVPSSSARPSYVPAQSRSAAAQRAPAVTGTLSLGTGSVHSMQ